MIMQEPLNWILEAAAIGLGRQRRSYKRREQSVSLRVVQRHLELKTPLVDRPLGLNQTSRPRRSRKLTHDLSQTRSRSRSRTPYLHRPQNILDQLHRLYGRPADRRVPLPDDRFDPTQEAQ